jgi:hypothetical protein
MPPYPIALPLSANFLCLNAFLYLVLSYVTNPTTINAITEIPANTPRPMGRTLSFFPGRVKAAWDVELAAAAVAEEGVCEEEAESAADVADAPELALLEPLALALEDAEDDPVGVALVLTVDNPLTETAEVMVPDAMLLDVVEEGTDAELLLDMGTEPELMDDPDMPLELEPMDDPDMLLDMWVIEDISALVVMEPMDPTSIDIVVIDDMSALIVDVGK